MPAPQPIALPLVLGAALAAGACLGPNPDYVPRDTGADEATTTAGDTSEETTAESSTETETTTEGSETDETESAETSEGLPECMNGRLDGDETDVDCGGSCEPCADGLGCAEGPDCASGVCEDGTCQAPTCDDEVANGGEYGVDCGGPCIVCAYSEFVAELDDYAESSALYPTVSMFADGTFAVAYIALDGTQPQARWFDGFAEPQGPGVVLDDQYVLALGVGLIRAAAVDANPEDHRVIVSLPTSSMSQVSLRMVVRDAEQLEDSALMAEGSPSPSYADVASLGGGAVTAWMQDDQIWTRTYANGWAGEAVTVEPDPPNHIGDVPSVAVSAAERVFAWRRCNTMGQDCGVVTRRWQDGSFVGDAPTLLDTGYPESTAVAIGEDGRAVVVWVAQQIIRAAFVDAEGALLGEPWQLQAGLSNNLVSVADVAALSDGSFAIAWPDTQGAKIHMRRFIGPDEPLVTSVGDEAIWPGSTGPLGVSLDARGQHMVVTWSAVVEGTYQIQGQVVAF
ncbi:putative lipoprotein [Plesiocystis pacifica SIR-1]|uniref:Putative lipoprotein n=1 Tax=Plesiocystis pacifica SIR-1 TaxID=391625 RepID=A6GDG7_9BACT|nr:hypothetical protein [Plesiocystis pacifica]EDM76079.1 putative lipoprotein [Plesiocystis pacifica SIR-1]